jgi:alpha-tubulin suppressor-like RCC1 family protein
MRSITLLTALLLLSACSDDASNADPFALSDPRADMAQGPDLAAAPDMAPPVIDAAPDLDAPDLAPPPPAILLAAGLGHTCAARDGALYCWGIHSRTADAAPTPTLVQGMESDVSAVTAGNLHTCAIKAGALYCWGVNASGQVGVGGQAIVDVPTLVPNMEAGVSEVSAGTNHTCALRRGEVWCWGENLRGQLGDPANIAAKADKPRVVPGIQDATRVSAGGQHTCATRGDQVWCWGDNLKGQVGEEGVGQPVREPQYVAGLDRVSQLSVGLAHSCVTRFSSPSCWGNNVRGQLGDGTLTDSAAPTRTSPHLTRGVVAIAAGHNHTCALLDSALYCWGDNSKNQSGDANITNPIPAPIKGFTEGVTALVTGANHTCAVREGEIWCWGANDFQQLGNDDAAPSAPPTRVILP